MLQLSWGWFWNKVSFIAFHMHQAVQQIRYLWVSSTVALDEASTECWSELIQNGAKCAAFMVVQTSRTRGQKRIQWSRSSIALEQSLPHRLVVENTQRMKVGLIRKTSPKQLPPENLYPWNHLEFPNPSKIYNVIRSVKVVDILVDISHAYFRANTIMPSKSIPVLASGHRNSKDPVHHIFREKLLK